MALADVAGVSNVTLWDLARRESPSFASHTSKGTADLFTEKGFEALTRNDVGAINEFFELSLRIAFQGVTVSRAKNLFEGSGFLRVYDTPNGGYVQRMSIDSIKPVSPAYKNLVNGRSVDPFIVRKPQAKERFFAQNFDYQSFITLQDFQVKQIFVSEYGMGEFIAGIMQGLRNGYTIQESLNVKEAINAALNSEDYPLQDTQVMRMQAWDAIPTAAQLSDFILSVKNIFTDMTITEQTSAYNAAQFSTALDTDDLVVLMRKGLKNRIELELEVGAFNPDRLTIPGSIVEIDNFGGIYYETIEDSTRVYPMVDEFGAKVDGMFSTDAEDVWTGNNQGYTKDQVQAVDPNADVLAIIAQKGLVFENRQNPYIVRPIENPRGLYTNYWASSPNNGIVVDPYYQMVAIMKPQANVGA